MPFWFFLLCMDLLVPITAIIFGLRFRKKPPQNINSFFGYRTARSMKDQESWTFAHNLCGNIWYKMGLIMIPLSLITMFFVIKDSIEIVALSGLTLCFLQSIALILTIIPVELQLKRREENLLKRCGKRSARKKRKKKR